MIVTGVGTREPFVEQNLTDIMRVFCHWANQRQAILRSGAAIGMDQWFERLWTKANTEIYIHQNGCKPDRTKNLRRWHDGVNTFAFDLMDPVLTAQAMSVARRIHPNWKACGNVARALHARNIMQVLGRNLDDPSDIIVYYAKLTDDGSVSGGTRTAVMLAREHNIPEFNLLLPDDIDRLLEFMETHK